MENLIRLLRLFDKGSITVSKAETNNGVVVVEGIASIPFKYICDANGAESIGPPFLVQCIAAGGPTQQPPLVKPSKKDSDNGKSTIEESVSVQEDLPDIEQPRSSVGQRNYIASLAKAMGKTEEFTMEKLKEMTKAKASEVIERLKTEHYGKKE